MKLTYYRGPRPNFGDDLNAWLWPRILPDFFDEDESELFIGIGSILTDDYPTNVDKIVMGSGYGGYSVPPKLDPTWHIKFVRGPRTARLIGVDERLGIGDGAILIREVVSTAAHIKRHRFSFMPHWESAQAGLWQRVCEQCEFNYIDPRGEVEHVLTAILESSAVLTEAMHGAIVSDALRVPWIAMSPIHERHRSKWVDWASALRFDVRFCNLTPSGFLERVIELVGQQSYLGGKLQYHGHPLNSLNAQHYVDRGAECLVRASRVEPFLSSERRLVDAQEQMLLHVSSLRRKK